MSDVNFIEHQGKRILLIDVTKSDLEAMMEVFEKTKALIVKEPPQSVLTLTCLSKGNYHGVYRKIAKEFAAHNKPYVKAGAIVGLDEPTKKEFEEVMRYSHREFRFFDDAHEAADWLIQQ